MKSRSGTDVAATMDVEASIATVAALWACFEARDWAGARRLLLDQASLTWHASGERLLDADAIIRVNAIYPEGWTLRVLALNALQDGRVHSIIEVTHPPGRLIANSLFRFDGGRIAQVDEYWATVEAPPAWRTAEAIGAYERFGSVQPGQVLPPDLPLSDHLAMLARYNVWATRRLFEHVDALSEADYRRDAGLFFKSVHGTLNHLLVGEHMLWFRRFAGGESPKVALNDEVETDRGQLRERLTTGAQAWLPFITACDAARFASPLKYTTTRGVAMSLPFAATLAHVFNHGTHHRGQITAAVTMMGHPCPEIDLAWMLQAERTSS